MERTRRAWGRGPHCVRAMSPAASMWACAAVAVALGGCAGCGASPGGGPEAGVDLGREDTGAGEAGLEGGSGERDGGVDAGPQPLRVEVEVVDDAPCADWEVAPLWEPPASTAEVPELLWVFDPARDPRAREILRGSLTGWEAYGDKEALSRLGHVWMVAPEPGALSVLDERGRLMEVYFPGGGFVSAYESAVPHPPVVAPDGSVRAIRREPDEYLRYRWTGTRYEEARYLGQLESLVGEPVPPLAGFAVAPRMALGPGGRVLLSWRGTVTEACDTDDSGPPRPMRRFRWYRGSERERDLELVAVSVEGRLWLRNLSFFTALTVELDPTTMSFREWKGITVRSLGPAGHGAQRWGDGSPDIVAGWLGEDGEFQPVVTYRQESPEGWRLTWFDPAGGVWMDGPTGYTRFDRSGTAVLSLESWWRPELAVFGEDGSRLLARRLDAPPDGGAPDGPFVRPMAEAMRILPDGGVAWRTEPSNAPGVWYGDGLLGRNGVLVGTTAGTVDGAGVPYVAWRVDVRAPEGFTEAAFLGSNCYRNSWAGSP